MEEDFGERVFDDRVAAVKAMLADPACCRSLVEGLFSDDDGAAPGLFHLFPKRSPKPETVDLVLRLAHVSDLSGVALAGPSDERDTINAELFISAPEATLRAFHSRGIAIYGDVVPHTASALECFYNDGDCDADALLSRLRLLVELGYFSEQPTIEADALRRDAEAFIGDVEVGPVSEKVLLFLRAAVATGELDRALYNSLEGCAALEYLRDRVGDPAALRCTAPAKRARAE